MVRNDTLPRVEPGGAFLSHDASSFDPPRSKIAPAGDFVRQKLETVAMLATGLAHDFNNVLSTILAYSELALAELTSGSSPAGELDRIRLAAIHGAEVVRQLSVYCAEDEAFEDVSRAQEEIPQLLTFLVPEHSKAVGAVSSQFQQLATNVIINASGAMADVDGVIRLSTSLVMANRTSPEGFLPSEKLAQPAIATAIEDARREFTALIVEDEEGIRSAISKMLRNRGLVIIETGDGSAALDIIRSRKDRLDLLLLDLTLPGASSRRIYEEAKRLMPALPVIVTSAKSQEVAATSLATEIEHYLRKPYRLGDLINLIREALTS